jgi:hypothetical protein
MRAGVSAGGRDSRPPNPHAVSSAGPPVRRSAAIRPVVPVQLEARPGELDASDPYVRRFWVAAIGPDAVAELLRIVRAAEKGEAVRLPRNLPALLRTGLVRASSEGLIVSNRLPVVPREMRWRFTPALMSEHSRWLDSAAVGHDGHEAEGHTLT